MIRRGVGTDTAEIASIAMNLRSSVVASASVSGASQAGITRVPVQQFRIEVPHQSDGLRVEVAASGSVRAYVRYRAPIIVESGRVVAEQSTDIGTSVSGLLSLSSVPELQSGTYYIAVGNVTTSTVDYVIRATVIGGSALAGPRVTALTAGVAASGSVPSGPFLASRQFAIDAPSNATGLSITLEGSTDVDLYVNYGSTVEINDQGFPEADTVVETASSREILTLGPLTIPNARSGRYYVAVYNYDDTRTAQFTVTATIRNAPPPTQQTLPLAPDANGQLPLLASAGVGALAATQFAVAVPVNATSLRLEVTTNLDVDVLVRRGSAVAFRNGRPISDYAFTPRIGESAYTISLDSRPPLQAGTYYVALANWSASGGQVSIRYSLTTTSGPSVGPVIAAQNGVANGASFQPGLASGAWISILGTNLATTTRIWRDSDFIGNRLPNQLDGVSVNVNGRPGYVYYISPTQINALAPGDSTEGPVQIEVVTAQGRSSPVAVLKQRFAPAFFMLDPEGRKYLASVHADGTLLGKPNLFGAAIATRPAKPGDVILLFATGFGPTDPPIPEGQIVTQIGRLTTPVTIRIGNVVADVAFAGLVGAGLYQFNVTVPNLPAGDQPVAAEIGGVRSQVNAFITVQSQ